MRARSGQSDPRPWAGAASEDEARGLVHEFFREHGKLVGRVCRRVLRDPDEAEDAAQQTFLSAHRSLLGGTEPREPAAWLCAIATNECRARIRKRMEDAPPTDLLDETMADDLVELADDRSELDAVRTALAELPPRQRASILLRDFRGLSYEEVARVLDVSPPAVESLLFRARRTLRARVRGVATRTRAALGFPFALRDGLGRLLAESDAAGATPVAAKVAIFAAAGALGVAAAPQTLHLPRPIHNSAAAPEHHAAPALVAVPQERTPTVRRAPADVEPAAPWLHPRLALDRREARDRARSSRSSVRERSRAAAPVVRPAAASPPVSEDWSPPGPEPPPPLPEPREPTPALPEPLEPDPSPEPPGSLPESDDPDAEEPEPSDPEPGDPEPDGEPRESEEADQPDEVHPDSVADAHASELTSRSKEEAEEAEE